MLDHVIYPDHRHVEVRSPVFILGNPRSGTTLLHRLLAEDDQFITARLYESVFPAISLRRLIRLVGSADRRLGRPLRKVVDKLVGKSFSGWTNIHSTGLFDVEEDEQLFVYAAMSPVLALLFPFFDEIGSVSYADRLPPKQRERLMRYYVSSLRRQLYGSSSQTLLVKSTATTGRLAATLDVVPDMRIIHILRHPLDALASLLSMYRASWERLVPQVADDPRVYRQLASLFAGYYRYRMLFLDDLPPERVCEIAYDELVADPRTTIEYVYDHFRLDISPGFEQVLDAATRSESSYRSGHHYDLRDFGLTSDDIVDAIPDVFDRYGFDKSNQPKEDATRAGAANMESSP
ncbi:MAG: sulfotransferase [Rhodothermia bacterium]|nr:sulfotransferase [Rhodothermia bacterium]